MAARRSSSRRQQPGPEEARPDQHRPDAEVLHFEGQRFHPPFDADFAAAYAVQNMPPAMPAVEKIVITSPARCLRGTGSTARVTLTGPKSSVSIWLRT